MSGSRLFSSDPLTRVRTLWHEDVDGNVTIETQHDVEDIIDLSKASYNSTDERARFGKGVMHRVAQIPMPILMELERRGITKDPKAFKKWLNDPDNRVFRTRPGKV